MESGSEEFPINPSVIFKNGKWTDPPSTSTGTEAGTQGFLPRYGLSTFFFYLIKEPIRDIFKLFSII